MFDNKEAALKYLRGLDAIIMPQQFTYFNHCTFYIPEKYRNSYNKKTWSEIPKDFFQIDSELSFTERDKRIDDALSQGGTETAPITYSIPLIPHIPFIIRVIMPKLNSNLHLPKEYQNQLEIIYDGKGDHRHPKLDGGEKIYMFACTTQDEVSGKDIDILYGVREQDIIMYANVVWLSMIQSNSYPTAKMPEVKEEMIFEDYGDFKLDKPKQIYNDDFEFNHHTYSIPKEKTFSRYEELPILDNDNNVQAVMQPTFENNIRRPKSK